MSNSKIKTKLMSIMCVFAMMLMLTGTLFITPAMTVYAAGGTEVTQANVICQQYSYMDAGDYSGGSMYDTPPVEITNITLADAQAFGAAVTCPTTYWVVVYATDGDNLKWTSNGKTGEQTSTPRSASGRVLSAWCQLYNDDVFHFGGNYDPMKDVTFYFSKGLATPAETLLTTITATGQEQASYSVENIATVSFSYTAQGSSAYFNNGKTNWGWWGYGWTATVNASEGYIITKCVFYDDKDRTATDSETPFVVETTEEDKTPQVNGTPILANESKGITKIEVYGYATLVKKDVTSISLNKSATTVVVGANETLIATVSPDDATYKTVVWSSDNTNVAEVDSNGKITAKSVGTANITARATNGTDDTSDDFTATCVVTVHAHSYKVSVNGSTATVKCSNDCPDYKEYTVSLNATDKDYDGTTNVATITKSNDLPNTILVGTINYVGRDGTTYNSTTAPTNVGKYTASVTVGDKTITKNFEIKALAPVSFISSVTYNPSKNTVTIVVTTIRQYIILTSTTTIWQNNYYVAKNDVTINGPVYYGANVSLILFDDVTLLIRGGLKRFGSELTIYGQEGQDGLLQIEGSDNDYVIDGDNITVNGGQINLVTGKNGTLFSDNSSITFNSALNLTATNSQGEELTLESGKTYTGSELNKYTNFETTTKLATLTDVNVYQTGTLTYNGNPQTAVVSASATAQNEKQVVFTYSATENGTYSTEIPAFTNAGNHTVYYKANAENHEEATGSFVVTIDKADIAFTAPTSIENLVYTGNAQALVTAGLAQGGTIWYKLGDGEYSLEIPTATLVGTYTVYYKVVGDNNHNDIDEDSVQIRIAQVDKSALASLIAEVNNYYDEIIDEHSDIAATLEAKKQQVANEAYIEENVTAEEVAAKVEELQNALNNAKADVTKAMIAAIGEVEYNTSSLEKIEAAENAYNSLTNEQKLLVVNYEVLTKARANYNAVDNVVKKITAIGNVAYTEDSKNLIQEARTAYNALSAELKNLVVNYVVLTKAENDYNAVDNVVKKIDSIGEVVYVGTHNAKIEEARTAYNALNAEQKAVVTNYSTLTSAENAYATLKQQNETSYIKNEDDKVKVEVKQGSGIPNYVELNVEVKSTVSAEEGSADYEAILEKLEKNEKIAKVFNVKLIQTINGVETEIQPNDIEEGMIITVRMELPQGISVKNLRILHIHSANDMEFIENFMVNGNEISFDVNRLSEFALVTPKGLSGWAIAGITLGCLVLVGLIGFGCWYMMRQRRNKMVAVNAVNVEKATIAEEDNSTKKEVVKTSKPAPKKKRKTKTQKKLKKKINKNRKK